TEDLRGERQEVEVQRRLMMREVHEGAEATEDGPGLEDRRALVVFPGQDVEDAPRDGDERRAEEERGGARCDPGAAHLPDSIESTGRSHCSSAAGEKKSR